MKLEILMSCMHQNDDTLVRNSRITTDAVVSAVNAGLAYVRECYSIEGRA